MKKIFNNKKILYSVLFIVFLFVGGSAFVGGYYLAQMLQETTATKVKKDKDIEKALNELQKILNTNAEKNKTKLVNSEVMDYKESLTKIVSPLSEQKKEINHINPPKPIIKTQKPKLVIIMDDMSFSYQVRSLKNLHLKITPSFFPPTKRHPNTPKYAKEFKHYMVHFPMQASSKTFRAEPNTLKTTSSLKSIEKRVLFIKQQFPNVKFVNNHTGSKFTSNYDAMDRLFLVLKNNNLEFVDSRTTPLTKAPLIAKKYNQILFSRDVFLDNIASVEYIQNQLKKAIKKAKKKGYVIVICHPHSKTFEALLKSKQLLKSVEVIYFDELYQLYKKHKI